MIEPYYQTDLGTLYCGDCLEIMRQINGVDALITDPPFAFTGGISNGSSANISSQFFLHWWKDICNSLAASLKSSASGFIWCDWKTAKIISEGFEPQKQTYDFFRVSQMLYHFREMPGMGQPFRSSVDMIAYLRGPKHKNPPIPRDTLNHISEYWYYGKHDHHPAEKSPSITKRLLDWCSSEGDLIIDPFGGGGTTAVVCEQNRRRWISIELEEMHCETIKRRIEPVAAQGNLFFDQNQSK